MSQIERDLNMNICTLCNRHYYVNEDNNEHFCSLECSNEYNHEMKKVKMDFEDFLPLKPIEVDDDC